MSQSFNVFVLLCVVSFCDINAQKGGKVVVSVYYEALCSHSIDFITKQLYPALQKPEIDKLVSLGLVPYGKTIVTSNVNNDFQFKCNHGKRECYANKVHACALAKLPSPTDGENLLLEFVKCAMVKDAENRAVSDTTYPVTDCAPNEVANIMQCAETAEGNLLLIKYGNETNRIQKPLDYCPTIVFNGKFDAAVSKQAERNFIKTLCGYLRPQDQPKGLCPRISASGHHERPVGITILVAIFVLLLKM